MRIASEIPNYGMSCATDLKHNITTLVGEEVITKVIETGTFQGLGTTKAVLNGMRAHGMEYDFISLEPNPEHYRQALANNIGASGLHILNGYSIKKEMVPTDFTFDVPAHIIVDHKEKDRDALYRKELSFNVDYDLLPHAINAFNGLPELVILDSAGAVGFIEFKYLMSLLPTHEFWLVLDDIRHVKHYNSFEVIKSTPEKFQIYWESEGDHASAIIKVCSSSM